MVTTALYLILCRTVNPYLLRLAKCLSDDFCVKIICDDTNGVAGEFVGYHDAHLKECGYTGLVSDLSKIKSPGAWEKAFYFLRDQSKRYDKVFIWEDDVYCSSFSVILETMRALAREQVGFIASDILSKDQFALWRHWEEGRDGALAEEAIRQIYHGRIVYRSFNPFCVMSAHLVCTMLDFQQRYGKFVFHEVLLPSLAMINGERVLDLRQAYNYRERFNKVKYACKFSSDEVKSGVFLHQCKPCQYLETYY